jgi:succinate dehydrogenase / fumarate reductase, flavoprotein subunit
MKMPDSRVPAGPIEEKWSRFRREAGLISPARRKDFEILVVGAGLAGASTAASLAEQGYRVKVFFFQDSARRAHSVAAQGGVNASKNYRNDGDSVFRMFKDTLKGGDFRSREANVYRLAECSMDLIDQAVAQGVPFGREYSGYLSNRSFGGVQVSRTFYARSQTGQQLLLGSYQAMLRQAATGRVQLYKRHEMMDLITLEGRAAGICVRNLDDGSVSTHTGDAVVLATGGYGKIYYLSTLAMGCNASAIWRAHKHGAYMAAPSWIQFHPTCLPQLGAHQSKLTLMSESLRNDGRIWVPAQPGDRRLPGDIPEKERDYFLERRYPAYGNLCPRDLASRASKERLDAGHGIGPAGNAVYLDFHDAIKGKGVDYIKNQYGNLFEMYIKITGMDPMKQPMMISPAAHFTMGGLWVDYGLMSNLPGLFVAGEANFSDHGANRLGANSLLQACIDGYYILPSSIPDYLSGLTSPIKNTDHIDAGKDASQRVMTKLEGLLKINGNKTANEFHKELGAILYAYCGLSRNKEGLNQAIEAIRELKTQFYNCLKVPGTQADINSELEKAGRVADYLELAELMCMDALSRAESCGAHFRAEYQTPAGEGIRNDEDFCWVPVWKNGDSVAESSLLREDLLFETLKPETRNYKS